EGVRPNSGKMARSDPRASVRVTRGAGSGQHLASVLQEGRENANIDAGLGLIWRISVNLNSDVLPQSSGIGAFILDPERLHAIADEHREESATADPCPHIVIDNFLPEGALDRVRAEIPRPDDIRWIEFDDARLKKLVSKAETQLGAATRFLLYQLNSSIFIEFLEELASIRGLVPDPHFWGGGVHQVVRGGFLKIHSDSNRHPTLNLDRRLNLFLYL